MNGIARLLCCTILVLAAAAVMPGCADEGDVACAKSVQAYFAKQPQSAETAALGDCVAELVRKQEADQEIVVWLAGLAGASGLSLLAVLRKALAYRAVVWDLVKFYQIGKPEAPSAPPTMASAAQPTTTQPRVLSLVPDRTRQCVLRVRRAIDAKNAGA